MKYKSEIYEVIHQDAMANFEIGAISKAEMQKFDKMCLVKKPETAYGAKKSPEKEYAAAPQRHLGVSNAGGSAL